jgi:hypothetical protein
MEACKQYPRPAGDAVIIPAAASRWSTASVSGGSPPGDSGRNRTSSLNRPVIGFPAAIPSGGSNGEVDGASTDALQQIVPLLDVDRRPLVRFAARSDQVYVTHSWTVDRVPAVTLKSVDDAFSQGESYVH